MGLGLDLNNSKTALSHNILISSITTHIMNIGRSGGWNVRLQRHHSQERYFFLCLRLEGLNLDLGGVLWDYFMAWYGVWGRMEGTGAPCPSASREITTIFSFVCTTSRYPLVKGKKDISGVSESTYGRLPGERLERKRREGREDLLCMTCGKTSR